jgi:hypothetical protein
VNEPRNEIKIGDELKKMEWEPILPIEKKLVVWSLVVGAGSIGLLVWLSRAFFES